MVFKSFAELTWVVHGVLSRHMLKSFAQKKPKSTFVHNRGSLHCMGMSDAFTYYGKESIYCRC
jgi:hypothetical protein